MLWQTTLICKKKSVLQHKKSPESSFRGTEHVWIIRVLLSSRLYCRFRNSDSL